MKAFSILAAMLVALPACAADDLVKAQEVIVDPSLPPAQRDAEIQAARRYATFWHTGDERHARAALASDFTDRTLPPGRAQGVPGPLAASRFVRTAIPDLQADLRQMIVAGDRVTVHYRFHGHFKGKWRNKQGQGQAIDFIATDIYRIADGKIADNWHIEDNLTLMQQLGLVAR
jgi:predicted ester cyclase